MPPRSNRLVHESSPYLQQHAHNPVDWFPWGDEAFEAAVAEDKPVLLSVGYSACHWCHVMERESFENQSIADLMNQNFINIKVDREERPDVDSIYMSAIQLMTGQGGWPMTVFLTTGGKPFYGGTYYPPEDRYGHPGFPRVLAAVAEAWKDKRDALVEQGQDILDKLLLGNDLGGPRQSVLLTDKVLDTALDLITSQFDNSNGGFGGAPKFPQPAGLDFLMRCHSRTNRIGPLAMVEKTCRKMALGGIYDQLGGGFHRYSTDSIWLAPHFEKMLYDNAQLAQTYARLWQATGKTFYKGIAEETLEYIIREMTGPKGEFFSAQDADSESTEGKFFTWTPAQLKEILGERDARVFGAFFDVTDSGNWEGVNILRVVKDAQEICRDFHLSLDETARTLDSARAVLLEHRNHRIKPSLDDKALSAWNGLALAAFAECAAVFNRADFYSAARNNAEFIQSELGYTDTNGLRRLHRTYREGRSTLNGYLEDYSFVADGLLRLYEADGNHLWISRAEELTRSMIALFWDEKSDGFYTTSLDHEQLIHRPKSWDDNACPSGNSVAVDVLLRLSDLRGNSEYRRLAELILRKIAPILEIHPLGFGRMLSALDQLIVGATEISIVAGTVSNEEDSAKHPGASHGAETDALPQSDLVRAVFRQYVPTKIVAYGDGTEADAKAIPLLNNRRQVLGLPTAYVCRSSVCKAPVVSAEDLLKQLKVQ